MYKKEPIYILFRSSEFIQSPSGHKCSNFSEKIIMSEKWQLFSQ